MAIDSYDNLKAAIVDWSHRNDMTPDRLDQFIDLAEEGMFSSPLMPLELRQMETKSELTASTSSRLLALPSDYLEMRRLKVNLSGGDCDIQYLTPEQLPIAGTSGIPKFFTVTDQIEFDRTPDSAYTIEIQYYAKPTALSDANTTNVILTNHPKIYLHGALSNLYQWTMQNDLAEYHENKFQAAMRGANKQYKRGRYGPAPKMRIEGPTP